MSDASAMRHEAMLCSSNCGILARTPAATSASWAGTPKACDPSTCSRMSTWSVWRASRTMSNVRNSKGYERIPHEHGFMPARPMPERGTGVSWRGAAACIALLALCFNHAVHAAPGELDRSFSADGAVLTDFGGFEDASAVVVQPDGKLVAAGTAFVGGNRDFALARYHPDGRLDTSFGSGGLVLTDFGDWTDDGAASLAIQPDGKLVAAGFSNAGRPGDFDFALARYNPDGGLDTSFGVGGKLRTFFGGNSEGADALVIQPDGKIVAAGFSDGGSPGDSDFALARYNPDGRLDTSFGFGGTLRTSFGGDSESAKALVIQPDGKLVAAGFSNGGGADDFDFAVARYNPDGSLDPSFGGGGFRTFLGGSSEGANALVVQADGKLVAAGFSNAGGPGDFDFALVRYLPNGSLDMGFGFGGTLRTFFGGDSEGANALVIQTDGKLIAAGFSNGAGPNDFDFAVARYNFDGSLDTSFDDGIGANGGFRTFLGGGNFEGAEALAIQPDGKLVAAGFSNSGGDDDFALTRYVLTDDTPPPPPLCGGRPVTILGTSGNDTIRGTDGPDVILGLGGNDVIRGLGGDDILCGGPGNDRLMGGPGRDRMFGQGGNDRLFGDKGKDRHDGGSGRDTCDRDRVEKAKGCERTTGRGRPGDPPRRVPPSKPPIAGICNTPGCL
jgi:uncharacterized delta-60 repeat protein